MRVPVALLLLAVSISACGKRPEPLMPDHLGSGAEVAVSSGPRALVAHLAASGGATPSGSLVVLPGEQVAFIGGAVDGLERGRYQVSAVAGGLCERPEGLTPLGEIEPDRFGQSKFSLQREGASVINSLIDRAVIIQGPLAVDSPEDRPVVVACGVFRNYAG